MYEKEDSTWERIGRGHFDDCSHWELFADEEIYKRLLHLRQILKDHRWGAKLNQGDGGLIVGMIKDLEAVANSLYLARKELVEAQEGAQEQEPPAEKILKDLLRCYHSAHYYTISKTGHEYSFCLAMMNGLSEKKDPKFHNSGCPLPEALKWLEEQND